MTQAPSHDAAPVTGSGALMTQGVTMPRLGFGTFRMPGGDCQPVVESALGLGYRHLDTAAMYDNEAAVGAAIRASGLARRDLFVTTKVWHDQLGSRDAIRGAFDASLAELGLDHVDLYMVHWPSAGMDMGVVLETLTRLREEGRTRAIGVCNFNLPMMQMAVDAIGAPIAALQVEYHPFLDQSALLGFLRRRGIPMTAYAPLAQGRAAADETLRAIGDKHGASAAQVAIAWLLDHDGVAAIPKAQRPESQAANLVAAAIRLDDHDRRAIAALPKDLRYVRPPFAPDWDAPADKTPTPRLPASRDRNLKDNVP
ncbi:aldo/keto reductase [Lichenihabitans sp. PAMC28606]|uniref:aldo/keto reductase n=1 Tax=Lichenihabitans sp. PAMC28606 TaxID=2880932 RepID=UPI001D0B694D|nr:aldo/keto reductase [Lichenihabitans sp. PAMC28606]UDL94072.1 aldo/keto reductase [Lichenihabitans sp. PAMC28606]